MRKIGRTAVAFGWAVVLAGAGWADDEAAARALLEKAIQAQGGEAELAKHRASTAKIKGTVQAQGMEFAFAGEIQSQGADQMRIAIDLEAGGEKFFVASVLNRDRGWVKLNEVTVDMDEEKLAEALEEAHAGWVATLVPLKDKSFALATVGEVKVGDRPAAGLRVSRKGRRDVTLYFDKETHLLVKTETRVKDEESGQEVTEETFLSAHAEKGGRPAMKITVKRDGKPYVEAEVLDYKAEEKLDDSVFAKP